MAASSTWITHVDIFVDPDGPENKQAASYDIISKLLLNGTITLQQLVLVAGKYLTSSDNIIRTRGLLLLAESLHDLADTPLEDTTIHSLATFFSDRLQDWHSLRPALTGSLSLLRRQKRVGAVHSKDVEKIAMSVVNEVEVQALSQRDRMLSLELYECLLFLHGPCVKALGSEFVLGIIAAIDGEKDARNTLLAFRLIEQLVALLPDPDGPLKDNAKYVFDVLSCYFPVTYNPPQDARGITREDLSLALLKVFTATSAFAPFCFPEFLEKLSSTLEAAKLDALKYIGQCALSYGPEVTSQFFGNIWLSLKSEFFRLEDGVLDPKDTPVRQGAFSCFTLCIEASQKGKKIGDQVMGGLLKMVLEDEDVLEFFRLVKSQADQQRDIGSSVINPTLRTAAQLQTVGRMLGAAARASSSACYIIAKEYFSSFLPSVESAPKSSEYQLSESVSASGNGMLREACVSVTGLEATLHILEGAKELAQCIADSSKPSFEGPASEKWLEPVVLAAPCLIHVLSQIVAGTAMQKELMKPGVAGLQALATFPPGLSPLSEDQLETLLTFLTATFLDKTKGSDVKEQALGAIVVASKLEEESRNSSGKASSIMERKVNVLNVVVPKLLEAVQETLPSEPLKPHLRALAALSNSRETVRLRVLKALGNLISNELGRALVLTNPNCEFANVVLILRSLSGEIIPFCEIGSIDQVAACDVVKDILRTVGSLHGSLLHIATDIFLPLMAVVRVTVQRCPEELQHEILGMGLSVLQNKISSEQSMELNVPQALVSNTGCTEGREWCVALIGSVIVALLPSVVLEEREMLLRLFVRVAVADQDPLIRDVAAHAAASLLNKWQEKNSGTELDSSCTLSEAIAIAFDEGWIPMVNEVQTEGTGSVRASFCPANTEKLTVRSVYALSLAWKGLAMRGHSRTSSIAGLMLRLLQSQGTPTSNCGRPVGLDLEVRSEGASLSPVGMAAVESFGIVMKDHPTVLSKSQNAVIRPLYKQRFFTSMLSPLIEAVRGNQSSRVWFYRAFASLLSGTPLSAALTEGKRVFPLVLEGLSTLCIYSEDTDYLLQLLLALSSFVVDENHGRSIVAEYVQSVVTRLIPLVLYESSMVIRESALQCLAAIVGLPFTRVFPVKAQVLKAITAALDDKKRLVRQEAVRCRQVWSAISSK